MAQTGTAIIHESGVASAAPEKAAAALLDPALVPEASRWQRFKYATLLCASLCAIYTLPYYRHSLRRETVWALLVIFTVYGIGFGMVNAPITNAAVSGMPRDRAGAASAVTSTSRQVGVSIGVALCGSVAGAALASVGADFLDATRPLWFIGVALGLVVAGLAVFSTSERARRSAEHLAPLIEDRRIEDAHVA